MFLSLPLTKIVFAPIHKVVEKYASSSKVAVCGNIYHILFSQSKTDHSKRHNLRTHPNGHKSAFVFNSFEVCIFVTDSLIIHKSLPEFVTNVLKQGMIMLVTLSSVVFTSIVWANVG